MVAESWIEKIAEKLGLPIDEVSTGVSGFHSVHIMRKKQYSYYIAKLNRISTLDQAFYQNGHVK